MTNTNNAGVGSLRWAMTQANSTVGADTIQFAPRVFATKQEIRLSGSLPTLTDAGRTTIDGPGSQLLTISGEKKGQIFVIQAGARATISGLNLSGGLATNKSLETHRDNGGGAISNAGDLVVANCILEHNTAASSSDGLQTSIALGGAVYSTGSLNLDNCTFTDNSADSISQGKGGAVYNTGVLAVTNCSLSHNTAYQYGGAVYNDGGTFTLSGTVIESNKSVDDNGGGVYNEQGSLAASMSTLIRNDAYDYGGGLFNSGGGGVVSLTGCTLSDNKAEDGGGLYNNSGSKLTMIDSIVKFNKATASTHLARGAGMATWGDAILTGCTIAHNTADNSGGGIYQGAGTITGTNCTVALNVGTDGAGVCNSGGAIDLTNLTIARNTGRTHAFQTAATGGGLWINGTAHVVNTLIAGNTSDRTAKDNVDGTIDGQNNQIGGGAEKFLGALANNGGPTPTMALWRGSPAIGAGVPNSVSHPMVPTTDQRGQPRNDVTDVGAFQYSGNRTRRRTG